MVENLLCGNIQGVVAMRPLLTQLARLERGGILAVEFDKEWFSAKKGPLQIRFADIYVLGCRMHVFVKQSGALHG